MIISFRYPKSSSDNNKDIMNEVQDFSMPNKNKQVSSNKGKLDSMLDKLMKRKSCVSNLRSFAKCYFILIFYIRIRIFKYIIESFVYVSRQKSR